MRLLDVERIDAVIFDMDGLMLDTERIALRVIAEAAAALGYPWHADVGLAMVGLNAHDSDAVAAAYLGPDYPVGPLRDAFAESYQRALETEPIPLKPGLLQLLDWLEHQDLAKAVATSTKRVRALLKLQRTGLAVRFPVIVAGDDVSRGKPAPDIFLAAAAALDVSPRACLVLEDSGPGVLGALAAGMQVIMVPDVLPPSEEIAALRHPVCESLMAALPLLSERAGKREPESRK
jgi:HAD superfamily hydrolase (TIGR01509 family)